MEGPAKGRLMLYFSLAPLRPGTEPPLVVDAPPVDAAFDWDFYLRIERV